MNGLSLSSIFNQNMLTARARSVSNFKRCSSMIESFSQNQLANCVRSFCDERFVTLERHCFSDSRLTRVNAPLPSGQEERVAYYGEQ